MMVAMRFVPQALLGLLAFAVRRLWRHASAARHGFIWLATFAVLALLPLTLLLLLQLLLLLLQLLTLRSNLLLEIKSR